MPRLFVLTTLPHRRPENHRFERVNGRHLLRMRAPRRVGLPYGTYPRLLLVYLTTEAVRTKSPEIELGATANDLARKLGLSAITGPRGTAHRLENQLHRLLSTKLDWKISLDLHPASSESGLVASGCPVPLRLARELLQRRPVWRSQVVLGQGFFEEITRSAVPIDLRAIRQLKSSPFAVDLYVWLTYRASYLRKPCSIPWSALEDQFGANYARTRDFRRRFIARLREVVQVYSAVRLRPTNSGLMLFPFRPHVHALSPRRPDPVPTTSVPQGLYRQFIRTPRR